jgi:hypothetical protein
MTTDEWRANVDRRLGQIDARLTRVETKNAVDEVHRTNVEKRLGGIEDTLKWLVRLIMGALILAVVGFMLRGGLDAISPL